MSEYHTLSSEISVDASKIPKTADTNPATQIGYQEFAEGEFWDSDTYWAQTNKQKTFKRYSELNQGRLVVAGRWNTPYETYEVNRDTIETLSSHLELSESQRREARCCIHALDLEDWGIRGDVVAFTLCQYIVHNDEADVRSCHPHSEAEDVPKEFHTAFSSLDIPEDRLASAYGKVAHAMRYEQFSFEESANRWNPRRQEYEWCR
jgi:hypothetical protein